jgi:hypothetical protein
MEAKAAIFVLGLADSRLDRGSWRRRTYWGWIRADQPDLSESMNLEVRQEGRVRACDKSQTARCLVDACLWEEVDDLSDAASLGLNTDAGIRVPSSPKRCGLGPPPSFGCRDAVAGSSASHSDLNAGYFG